MSEHGERKSTGGTVLSVEQAKQDRNQECGLDEWKGDGANLTPEPGTVDSGRLVDLLGDLL